MEIQEGIRRQAQQRQDFAKNLASWADKKNKKESAKDTRKRKRNLPPVRGSINQKVEPKAMEDGDMKEENVARTKPLPAGVVCERYKIEGNNYFKCNEFDLAIDSYSKAIKALPTNPIPWANRAMARLKQKQYALAEEDCNECLYLDATYVKAFYRRGQSRQGLKKWGLAIEDFQQVLKLNAKDQNAQKMLAFCKRQLTRPETKTSKKTAKPEKKKKRILIQMVDEDEEDEIITRKLKIEEGEDSSDEECSVIPKKRIEPVKEKIVEIKSVKKTMKIEEVQESKQRSPVSDKPKKVGIEVLHEEETKAPGFIPRTPEKRPATQKKENEAKSPLTQSPYRPDKSKKEYLVKKPHSYFEFSRIWESLGPEDKAELILSYDPKTFPSLFGQCLSKQILDTIVEIYAANVVDAPDAVIGGLQNLPSVPRFELLTMFMGSVSKKYLGDVWSHLERTGVDVTQMKRKWS